MDLYVDHFRVLGLPDGGERARFTEKEISKAYKLKAFELHPDKRPGDPNAHATFQKLKASYEILKDQQPRKSFLDHLQVKRDQQVHRSQPGGARWQKMTSDLEQKERAAFAHDLAAKGREEEEVRISRKLQEVIARIIAMMKAKKAAPISKRGTAGVAEEKITNAERKKYLRVSWEKKVAGEDYTVESLRELFSKFGGVEDVVFKSSKRKVSALIVMETIDAAVAAAGRVSGNTSLLVSSVQHSSESEHLGNSVGPGYKAYGDEVLEKPMGAAAAQKEK